MSVASFVAAQRTDYGVPHVIACRALGVRRRGSTSGATAHRRRARQRRAASTPR